MADSDGCIVVTTQELRSSEFILRVLHGSDQEVVQPSARFTTSHPQSKSPQVAFTSSWNHAWWRFGFVASLTCTNSVHEVAVPQLHIWYADVA